MSDCSRNPPVKTACQHPTTQCWHPTTRGYFHTVATMRPSRRGHIPSQKTTLSRVRWIHSVRWGTSKAAFGVSDGPDSSGASVRASSLCQQCRLCRDNESLSSDRAGKTGGGRQAGRQKGKEAGKQGGRETGRERGRKSERQCGVRQEVQAGMYLTIYTDREAMRLQCSFVLQG